MPKYAKFYIAAAGVLAIFFEAFSDGKITPAEWAKIGTAALVAAGVHQIPNGNPPPAGDAGSITLYDIVLVAVLVCAVLGAIVLWRKV